ncbi:MAG TPA: methylmalonyl-CoA mutase family protein [Marmoricola sp.]
MESLSLETGPSHAPADWEAAAAAVLRKSGRIADDAPDAEVWAKLTRRTLDGIAISPLGTPALDEALTTSGRPSRTGAWDVCAYAAGADAATVGEEVLTDLENGVTAVWLAVGGAAFAATDIGTALDKVLLDAAPVVLDAPADPMAAAEAFAALVGDSGVNPDSNLGADPIGAHIRGFNAGSREDDAMVVPVAAIARRLGCRAVVADGTVVHDRGASDVQEVAFALEVAATYLRLLVEGGSTVAEAAGLIEFRLAATDEQFPTIAKFRALRRLWSRVLELSGVTDAAPARVHAVTSRPMMSKYDPWVNMLRTCVGAFAAGVGGADMVTVLPFDEPLGAPDAFSRRIARNTSALLIEESHVAVVADPAGGSHVVEKLTDDLAVAAWAEFGELDVAGGLHASSDAFQERIARVVGEREKQVANRKRPITGLSEFPNLHETLPERAPALAAPVVRYGHAFEALRDEPVESQVFLATMGTVAAHTARATFASNLFAAGGIDVVNEGAHDDVDAVLGHYRGEPVACLVGNDAAYAEWGTELATRLREAGASWVIVAGKPLDGCDDNCAMGIDALDFLARTRSKLEA